MKKQILEKKKHFVVNSDIFKFDIFCFINYGHKEMVDNSQSINKTLYKYLKDIKQEEDQEGDEGQMYFLQKGAVIRVKFYKDQHRKNISIISHEITHIVQYILRDRRIPLTIDTEEVYAYLQEDLLLKFLYKWY